jgi:uncharacterized protein (UPF0262 family)
MAAPDHRLQSVVLDDESLAAVSRDQEQERQIAIFDLLEDNHFAPAGADGGPYDAWRSTSPVPATSGAICCRCRRFAGSCATTG